MNAALYSIYAIIQTFFETIYPKLGNLTMKHMKFMKDFKKLSKTFSLNVFVSKSSIQTHNKLLN
ncbi:MAG TPA: hypothetical protein DCZ48_12885 [Methylococcaceae bacterium]|nr:hypothetical protein [Methylococcaceae bacterium]